MPESHQIGWVSKSLPGCVAVDADGALGERRCQVKGSGDQPDERRPRVRVKVVVPGSGRLQ